MSNAAELIGKGEAVLGIEFGSTRIKAVLIDDEFKPIAQGSHDWENRFVDGVWTYSLDDIDNGLKSCYKSLKEDVKSGIIGDVVDVKASLSKIMEGTTRELDPAQAGGAMNEHAPLNLMAIIKLLGKYYSSIDFYSKIENGVDIYTKANINYPHATSSLTVGIGVKTEGNLVVSGTKGYIYVPAPWWLTDYFEVRYEDQTKNKKYFYSYDGEGLRYEIQEFVSMIVNGHISSYKLHRKDSTLIANIIEKFNNRENVTLL